MVIANCGGLNEKGPHRLIGSVTIGRCSLVGGGASLGVGFSVSEAHARPSVVLSSYYVPVQM